MSRKLSLSLVAAAVATTFSGQAGAVQNNIAGAGASAVSNTLKTIIMKDYCTAGTINYYDNDTKNAAGGAVYRINCTNNGLNKLVSNPVDVSYDTSGGSWKGLTPTQPPGAASPTAGNLFQSAQGLAAGVAAGGATYPVSTVSETVGAGSCAAGVAMNITPIAGGPVFPVTYFGSCPAQALATAPTFGLTDTDAALFQASAENQPLQTNTWNTGPVALVQGSFIVGSELTGFPISVFGLAFGVAASKQLYLDLQADQIASGLIPAACSGLFETSGEVAGLNQNKGCAPSITRAQYRSIVTNVPDNLNGDLATGVSELFFNGLPATQTCTGCNNGAITVARRDRGSGSQATSNAFFLGAGCGSAATEATELPAALPVDGAAAPWTITYNFTTGGVVSALTGAAANTYVIGVVSADNEGKIVPNGGFLRIDNNYPSNVNAANGVYNYWTEEQLHCSPAAFMNADQNQLCQDLGGTTAAGNPADSAPAYTGIGVVNLTYAGNLAPAQAFPFPQAVVPKGTFFHLDTATTASSVGAVAHFCAGPYAY